MQVKIQLPARHWFSDECCRALNPVHSHVHSQQSQVCMKKVCKNTYCNKHVKEIIACCGMRRSKKCTVSSLKRSVYWRCKNISSWMDVLCLCSAYIGWEPVGWCGLVDVVVVVVCVGATLCGLPLPPANRATLHHTAAHLCWCFLRGSVWITVFCHHSVREEERWEDEPNL